MKIVTTHSAGQTRHFALQFAKNLQGGEVLVLSGPLGSGKTVFVQGLGRALHVIRPVKSPGFTYLHVYPTKYKKIHLLCHVDLYRVTHPSRSFRLALKDYLGRKDVVSVVEWGERLSSTLKLYKPFVIRFQFFPYDERKIVVRRVR